MKAVNRLTSVSGGGHKIMPAHLQRLACIYIRQSSLKQVEHNRESQFNQYQLAHRAETLGWHPERIRVIDADLGLSGQGSDYRTGFKELVTEVSLGHVGIIFGYEVSRLARNNSDWYQLLDLAAMFGTLIADNDGIYDPRLYNDRLLLGLKGTMSEAELHLIRQRLAAGRLTQVRRGLYQQRLPTGLIRLEDGSVVKDPDEQVRHTLELVLTKFAELGSGHKVLRYLHQAGVLVPRRQMGGPQRGEVIWKLPTDGAIHDIITNPAYAGAFAYGRRQQDPTRQRAGRPTSGVVDKPLEEWIHLQQDVYPAYISWSQYLANQERLRQNATRFFEQSQKNKGVPREGRALLQGMVTCGLCGHRMQVAYKSNPRYHCYSLMKRVAGKACASINAASVEEVVVRAFFEAIRPAQLDVLEAVLAQQHGERKVVDQQWQERLKRAEYEARLAQRQYVAVDPDNRLVAAELERRWEEKLRQLQETQEAIARFHQQPSNRLTPELRAQFEHLSERLPELWDSGTLSHNQKKEFLRSLIDQVILKRETPDTISVKIVWVSGHYSVDYAHPPIRNDCDVGGYETMIEQIGELWAEGVEDEQIATQLTAAGFRSARCAQVLPHTVQRYRLANGWYHGLHLTRGVDEFEGQLTTRGLAAQLGVHRTWVQRRIQRGQIPASHLSHHPQSRFYLIRNDPDLMEQLRQQAEQRPERFKKASDSAKPAVG